MRSSALDGDLLEELVEEVRRCGGYTNARPAGSGQSSTTYGWIAFGRDPNDYTNATGPLNNDRTHMFRVQGA